MSVVAYAFNDAVNTVITGVNAACVFLCRSC